MACSMTPAPAGSATIVSMKGNIAIGGLVAAGFDPTSRFLLTVTHSGRGVFLMPTWERVARDYELAYPEGGNAIGIGPIAGMVIPVVEFDSDHDAILISPDGRITLTLGSSYIIEIDTLP